MYNIFGHTHTRPLPGCWARQTDQLSQHLPDCHSVLSAAEIYIEFRPTSIQEQPALWHARFLVGTENQRGGRCHRGREIAGGAIWRDAGAATWRVLMSCRLW